MIRLEGRFELDEYWKYIRQMGNDRLKDLGFNDWVVTVRPLAAGDSKDTAHDAESVINISGNKKTLDLVVEEKPELPADSFVQTSIIDVIEQATHALGDDDDDWVRDEGGES